MLIGKSKEIETNCPNCGAVLESDSLYCPFCNTDVTRKAILNFTPLTRYDSLDAHIKLSEDDYSNTTIEEIKEAFTNKMLEMAEEYIRKNITISTEEVYSFDKGKEYSINSKLCLTFVDIK